MHTPYQEIRKYPPDFKVKYRFYSFEEGGRKTIPFQGIRCDFAYKDDNISKNDIYMIHPEFLDENGKVILDNSKSVSDEGYAYMWILFPKMRESIHQNKIKIGVKGYFQEGSKRTGEVEVVEVLGLHTNPMV